MNLPPLWETGGPYSQHTGLPLITTKIFLQISERYSTVLGHPEPAQYMAAEVTARTIAIPSHDDALERQIKDSSSILRHSPKGSRFTVERRIFPMNRPAEAAWLEAVLYFPAETPVDNAEAEVFAAMETLWHAWWLADDLAGTASAPVKVLGRAVEHINTGIHWSTALSMAALEQDQKTG